MLRCVTFYLWPRNQFVYIFSDRSKNISSHLSQRFQYIKLAQHSLLNKFEITCDVQLRESNIIVTFQMVKVPQDKLHKSLCSLSTRFSANGLLGLNTFCKYWYRTVPGYIYEMFQPSLWTYSKKSQMALDMFLQKISTGQKSLSFLGPKI